MPDELIQMLNLARDAQVCYETETGTFDEETMIWFRDTLFDLAKAAESDSPNLQMHYVGAAMEHLALAIAEPLQSRTEEILAEINQPVKLFKIFRLTHSYRRPLTDTYVSSIKRLIHHHLTEGRKAKARVTVTDARRAYTSFLEAYKSAVMFKEILQSRKPKVSIKVLLWLISIMLAGSIGAVIARVILGKMP